MTATDKERREIFALAASVHELIECSNDIPWAGELLAVALTTMYERCEIDALTRVLTANDAASRLHAAGAALLEEQQERASQEIAAAIAVDCPDCERPAGERCVSRTGKLPAQPHRARVKASHGTA